MTLQQSESVRLKLTGGIFLSAAKHVPPDRVDWSPAPGAKSAGQIVQHIAWANDFFAALIRGEAPREQVHNPDLPYADALARFERSVKALAETLAAVPDAQLDDPREMPWGQTWKVKHILMSGSAHIAYHWGQIGYLQSAWGDDTDYHLR